MTPPPAGTPWWAWGLVTVVLAVIGLVGIWVGQRKFGRQLGHVVDQVKNSHDLNLRDDLDEKDAGTKELLERLVADVAEVKSTQREHGAALVINTAAVTNLNLSVGGLHEDLRQAREADMALEKRVLHLEHPDHPS